MALSRLKTWIAGEVLAASDLNSEFNNILTNALTLISPLTGSLNAGGYKITNYGGTDAPSARSDVPIVSQVQDQSFVWCGTAGGTANAITLTPAPAITAYAAGQAFTFKAGSSSNTGATTVAISGLATKAVQNSGAVLVSGDISANLLYRITYDGTAFQLEHLAAGTSSIVQSFVGGVDFTAGTTTQLTLSNSPGAQNNIDIYFDGARQENSTYSIAGAVITFTAVIPVACLKVEIKYSVNITSTTYLVPADIGVTVQAYDADTAKLDVVQSWTKAQRGTPVALTSSAAAIAIDMSLGNNFSHTATENTTAGAPTNMVAGQSGVILFTQHASAAKTFAFNAAWVLPSGANGTVTTTLSGKSMIFYSTFDASTVFYDVRNAP